MTVTGERVTTSRGGFNPTWQRHVADYARCAPFLGPDRVLDVGCGIGHSAALLAPRASVGLDISPTALAGQQRPLATADMRRLPFATGTFGGIMSVQSIEHVPDPQRALAEMVRVLHAGGTAVIVTPNRLTFGRPDEIIDPYHYFECDAEELHALCRPYFASVRILGIFGSERYMEFHRKERRKLDSLLRIDPLRLRRLVPRTVKQRLYDQQLTRNRRHPDPAAEAIVAEDFFLGEDRLEESLDLVAVCSKQAAGG